MKEFFQSFVYAAHGLMVALREHRNLVVQLTVGGIVVAAGFYVRVTAAEWCILLIMIAIVISLEMINTAIENLVNLVTQEYNPLAGKIKDIAAGAVLFASFIAVIIGVIVFKKYL